MEKNKKLMANQDEVVEFIGSKSSQNRNDNLDQDKSLKTGNPYCSSLVGDTFKKLMHTSPPDLLKILDKLKVSDKAGCAITSTLLLGVQGSDATNQVKIFDRSKTRRER